MSGPETVMNEIIEIGIRGEQARGDNGAVLFDEENSSIVYLLSHEFKPSTFGDQLNELLSEDERAHIFVVHKTKDAMHISKIPRGLSMPQLQNTRIEN